MATLESYWNTQSDSLRDIRDQLGYERYQRGQYKPLPDRHPLLKDVPPRHKPHSKPRVVRTPPAPLHKKRTLSPPQRRHSPDVRTSKYDVIPPVKPRNAFTSPVYHTRDENDSWGEESSGEDENPMASYRGFPPYPMVMYPAYPMMMAPPAQLSSRKAKGKKDGKTKKKVHYRNTPIYLSSRENTKHSPKLTTTDPYRNNSVLERYNVVDPTPRNRPLGIGEFWDLLPEFGNDYVEKFIEECLDDTILPDLLIEVISELDEPMSPSNPYYPASFYYCEDLLDEEIPNLVREVVQDSSYHIVDGHLIHKIENRDPLEDFLNDLINEAVNTETVGIVKEVAKDIVAEHMEKAGAYDEILDMTQELIKEMAPGVVEEALLENAIEDLIQEELVDPEISAQCQELAVDTLTHYSNKVRSRDVRELKKNTSDKLKDSMMLDYLLAYIARQGELWTQGEHVNKLLDEITLSILMTEFLNVGEKKRLTADNKPVRKYYEKMVTDVAMDVLLEEISQSLDEDMADLDEYEQGLENPDINYEVPKDLKKWLDGR